MIQAEAWYLPMRWGSAEAPRRGGICLRERIESQYVRKGEIVADYTVPAGHVGVHAKTLVGGTVDTVTFTGEDLSEVEVLTDGSDDIYVSFGAMAEPAIGSSDCWRVPALPGSSVLPVRTSNDTVVKLISAGTPTYSISRT